MGIISPGSLARAMLVGGLEVFVDGSVRGGFAVACVSLVPFGASDT